MKRLFLGMQNDCIGGRREMGMKETRFELNQLENIMKIILNLPKVEMHEWAKGATL